MSGERGIATCTQPGCPVGQTGECQEGLQPPSTCPHYSLQPVPEEVEEPGLKENGESLVEAAEKPGLEEGYEPEQELESQTPEWIELPQGDALSIAELASIRAVSLPRMVILAGPPGAGKTTILTELYEKFLHGDLRGHLFCWSATLPGFEERSFLNRPESGANHPDTHHTQPSVEPRFLHLRTATTDNPDAHFDVLFSDISGEDFERIRNNADALKAMIYLRRADHLVIVIDGEAICDEGKRHTEDIAASQLLGRFIDSDLISYDCHLHVVVSKMDVVEHIGGDSSITFAGEVAERLVVQGEQRFRGAHQHFVAARPLKGLPTDGDNLDRLYNSWVVSGRPLPAGEGGGP